MSSMAELQNDKVYSDDDPTDTPRSPLVRKKRLRFALFHDYIDCTNDDGKIPANELWYVELDYFRFRHDCEQTVQLKRNGQLDYDMLVHSEYFSGRGIEHMLSKQVSNDRKYRREHARSIVFQEQLDQKFEGEHSPENIAALYEEVTAQCRRDAHAVGVLDADAQQQCWAPSADTDLDQKPFNALGVLSPLVTSFRQRLTSPKSIKKLQERKGLLRLKVPPMA